MHIPENYLSLRLVRNGQLCSYWYKAVKEVKVKVDTDKKRFLCWESGLPCPSLS